MTSLSPPLGLAPVGPGPARPATMRDVAAVAGVSLKTVSRVVNREAGVSPDLLERVAGAVRLLGYRHNLAASSLRRTDRKTATIALLVQDVSNPFFSALHRVIEDVARTHGSLVLAGSSDDDPDREREMLQAFASRTVDGLVVAPAGSDHSALLHEHRLGTPVVFVDRPDRAQVADSVAVDNRGGAASAVHHLAAHGHRRIAFLGDREQLWTAAERLLGFREAMLSRALVPEPALLRTGLQGSGQARAAMAALLALPEPPTAVFAAQNVLAVGAVQALQAAGRQRQVALVGFDDFPLADLLEPGVSVVAQDIAEIGRRAADLLFGRIAGSAEPASLVLTEPALLVRGSGEIRAPG